MLLSKQQPVGQKARLAIQGPFGRNPCQLRKIIAFREMAKDDIPGLAVVVTFKKFGRCLIREVAHTR